MKTKIILSIAILSLLSLATLVSAQDCIDSDDGKQFYKKGSVMWNGETLEDHCGEMQMANKVYEYYCEDDFQKIETFECPNGCEDGSCLHGMDRYNLINVDLDSQFRLNEKNYETESVRDNAIIQGTRINIKLLNFDRDETQVPHKPYNANLEILNKDTNEKKKFNVENGDVLSVFDLIITIGDIGGGVAVGYVEIIAEEELNCIEDENGIDFYKKGSVMWNGETLEDHCGEMQMANKVYEYYCEDDFQKIETFECPNGCEDGSCKKFVPGEEPIELPEEIIIEEEKELICMGCLKENKCFPIGYRTSEEYCSGEDELFTFQKDSESSCNNNFECNSNLCVNNECVSGSLWAKFMRWLNKLFG